MGYLLNRVLISGEINNKSSITDTLKLYVLFTILPQLNSKFKSIKREFLILL